MQITYLGHAGFLVETAQAIVVMDPWFSPEGAFDSAWFQYPRNHHLAGLVREKLKDSSKKRYLYVSHEHQDHFDRNFLRSLPENGFEYVLARYQRAALRAEIARHHRDPMNVLAHGEEIAIPGGSLKLYLDDTGLSRDSAILVKADGQTFLNLNDCKLYDEVPSIGREEGPISVFACQFSGATWHPICYDYPQPEYERISRQKCLGKFEIIGRMIEAVQPRVYVPSAGPPCFLDPALMHLNFEPVNIFPRASKFRQYIRERLPDLGVQCEEMMPGDILSAEDGTCQPQGSERVAEADFEEYVRGYAACYRHHFAEQRLPKTPKQIRGILDRLGSELERKLAPFRLHDRIRVPLYFGLSDGNGHMLRIDFGGKKVESVPEILEGDFYSVRAPSWQMARVLDGKTTWEEFSATFRVRLNRRPDVYQTLIQGFLLLEPEDMDWFCAKVLEIEQRKERIVIEAGGTCYSVDRYCPHQGGDLSQGWLSEGRFWTCPRHKWQFALDKEGRCTTSDASIHAICLESE